MQAFFFFFGLQVLCQAQCMSVMDSALWCDNCVCVMGEVKYLPWYSLKAWLCEGSVIQERFFSDVQPSLYFDEV